MTEQIITIPSEPIQYQNFFLNFDNPTITPDSSNSYVLKDINNVNVSNAFNVPIYGIELGPVVSTISASCSYIIKDSNSNFYFTDNQSFFITPSSTGNYNIYIATVNPNSVNVFISYTTDPELVDSNPIGLAIDSLGYFYVALQSKNKIKKYNSDGTGATDFIVGGLLSLPCGIIFDSSDNLYVANRFGNNVLIYNQSGLYVRTITDPRFNEPCAIAFNTIGELFISNIGVELFQINLTDDTVTQIASTSGRQSVNMTFDIDNNIYLPDFNFVAIYKLAYNSWASTYIPLYGSTVSGRIGGIITNNFGDIVMITNSSAIQVDLLYNSFWFTGVNLPGGYNTLILFNSTTNRSVTEITIFVKGSNPGTICFKERTKILCKINGKDVYIPIENIGEGTLVKTYKNGYKKCKFNMRELLKNTETHNINNLFRQSKLTNGNLFEDLYITGSHSMLYDNLSEKEEEAMYKLLATYNSKFDIEIPNRIEDKYKLIAYYDKSFTEVKQNISVYIYHLVLESDNNNRNYGIWANGALTESIDEFTLLKHLNNSEIKLVNVAKGNNKLLSKGTMNLNIYNKPLGTKHMNKLTMFK
jgi:hypothetical protein